MGIYRGIGGTGDSNTDATITEVTEKAAEAGNSATASANSASAASTSASGASTSATNASNQATNSANSATASANSATASANSASGASGSASTATTKASEAATSATNASNSATASANSATASANSATASANSATAGANSATAAAGSASTATTKASEASTSATNAANSATAASGSASTASTQASLATTNGAAQVNLAAAQVALATTQAGNATTNGAAQVTLATAQKTIATTKASEASTSASNAAASLASFTGQYVSQSSAPSSPSTGDLWFDTSASAMKVYNGSGWVNAGSSVNGTENSVQYTATANQTSFNAVYDAGYLQVYLNGIRLDTGDYTATNGSTVVLDIGATVNDVVFIHSFGTFALADHYTKTQSDARYAQESYVDTEIAALVDSAPAHLDTLNELAAALSDDANFSTTVTNSIATKLPLAGGTLTGDVSHGDNVKAKFGTGNDLQIYHDGSHSRISDAGTGELKIMSNGTAIRLQQNNGENMILAEIDGAVTTYHNGTAKLATTATGIDVTGNVTADGIILGDGTTNEIPISWNQSSSDFSIGANGSAFIIANHLNDLDTNQLVAIKDNGKVGIGTSDITKDLQVAFSDSTTTNLNSGAGVLINNTNTGTGTLAPLLFSTDSGTRVRSAIAHVDTGGYGKGDLAFYTMSDGDNSGSTIDTSDEAMRIDSSGNVLVGKTTTAIGTAGSRFIPNGQIQATASSQEVLLLNRLTSDGELLNFRKDGTTVGSINTGTSRIGLRSGDTGIMCAADLDAIYPQNDLSGRDAAIDLGVSGARFKDAYLSGGVYLGGTGAANKLDDYEEGTWTPTCGVGTVSNTESHYTKVGRVVHVTTRLSSFSNSSGSQQILISGLPFTCAKGDTNVGYGWGNFTLRAVYAYGASGSASVNFYSGGAGYGPTIYSDIGSAELLLKLEYITNS